MSGIAERLQTLGLTTAAKEVGLSISRRESPPAEMVRRLSVAYGEYRYVSQERIDAFNVRLRKSTMQEKDRVRSFVQLVFTPLAEYKQVPPEEVLVALESVKARQIFDDFEIAEIATQTERIGGDPILFGRIRGCTDRFCVVEWGEDVTMDQILKQEEAENLNK